LFIPIDVSASPKGQPRLAASPPVPKVVCYCMNANPDSPSPIARARSHRRWQRGAEIVVTSSQMCRVTSITVIAHLRLVVGRDCRWTSWGIAGGAARNRLGAATAHFQALHRLRPCDVRRQPRTLGWVRSDRWRNRSR